MSEKKGGRKQASLSIPGLEDNFVAIVSQHTAGDPMQEDVIWTSLSTAEIARRLAELGTPVCPETVGTLLKEYHLGKRQLEKSRVMDEDPDRNEQFEQIAELRQEYEDSPNPIISMDTKKKEFLGDFHRPGRAYGNGANRVFDHDFSTFAKGLVIPHGLYDLKRNVGHVTLGNSHDTSQFATASFALWWGRHGAAAYPDAASILLLCDGGGSNNSRHHIFKEDLQRLVNRIGIPIRVAHYPPYCSKYNPIEHRFFPHVTRTWAGLAFRTLDIVTAGLRRVRTETGLTATYAILNREYALQRTASASFREKSPILFAKRLPNWNYTVIPTTT
ncbi:MAG: ISAzo13 family transposase [Pirellulales bacterium]|nr:ISAzo13 family transposase [Pirellulales bacterium]